MRPGPFPSFHVAGAGALVAFAALVCLAGCPASTDPPDTKNVNPSLIAHAEGPSIGISDALEALIAADEATLEDRAFAYAVLARREPTTAEDAFARAATAGRMAQLQGIDVADHITEVEAFARQSAKLDPNFRDGVALRTLGTLYILAPGGMLRHGDADKGLEILQALVRTWPDDIQHRLRLAEALITLDEVQAAHAHLCFCLAHKEALRHDEQAFLTLLVDDADTGPCR